MVEPTRPPARSRRITGWVVLLLAACREPDEPATTPAAPAPPPLPPGIPWEWHDPWNWGTLEAEFCLVGGELATGDGQVAPTLRIGVDYTSDVPQPSTYDWYTYTSCIAELRLDPRTGVFGDDGLEGLAFAWDRTYPTLVTCSEPEVEPEFVAALAGGAIWAVGPVSPGVGEPCRSGNCDTFVPAAFHVPVTQPKTVWAQGRATTLDGADLSAAAVAASADACLSFSGELQPPDEW